MLSIQQFSPGSFQEARITQC
ncbi:hypothetical protein Nmel_005117 [Mimus melanotis]